MCVPAALVGAADRPLIRASKQPSATVVTAFMASFLVASATEVACTRSALIAPAAAPAPGVTSTRRPCLPPQASDGLVQPVPVTKVVMSLPAVTASK
jgi:hypothetical protein